MGFWYCICDGFWGTMYFGDRLVCGVTGEYGLLVLTEYWYTGGGVEDEAYERGLGE